MWLGLLAAVFVVGVPPPAPAEEPGEVRHSFAYPGGFSPSKSRWAFNNTLGRHYFTSGNTILVTDRNGEHIKSWDISASDNRTDFNNAHGTTDNGALFFINEATWYVLAADRTTMTVWNFQDQGDGTADLSLNTTIDFSLVLPASGATAIDRDFDGSWWIISEDSIFNINPQGTAIRRSVTFDELGDKILPGGTLNFRPELLAVDPISDALFVYHTDGGNSNFWLRFYRLDKQSLFQEGRFPLGENHIASFVSSPRPRLAGAHNGFVLLAGNSPFLITERSLEPQDLPDVRSVTFDQEGVMWTFCSPGPVNVAFDVDWGEGASVGQVLEAGPLLLGNSSVSAEPTISFPGLRLADYPAFPETFVLLRSENDQTSTPIPVNVPLAAYNGPVMFMPVCFFPVGKSVALQVATWSWSGAAPMNAFNAWVEFADYVPWVGGKRYGIKEVQATGQAEIASQGDGSVSIAGGGEFLMGPGKLRLEFGGGVIQSLTPEGPEVKGGLLTAKVAGTVSEEAGIVEAFPALAPLKSMALIGSAFTWLNNRAKLTASITIGLDSSTKVTLSDENDILFDGEMTAFLAFGVAAAVKLIGGYAEVSAYGEGKGSATFVPSSNGLTLSNLAITALVGGKIRAYLMERSFERVISISSSDGVVVTKELPDGGMVHDSGWQYAHGAGGEGLIPKSLSVPYVLTPNPFAEFDSRKSAGFPVTSSRSFDQEVRVLGGIPADASINSLASPVDNTMMAVWSQPIPGNPATQATDIWYSYFNGVSFSNPAPIYTDDRADFNPKVHYLRSVMGDVWIAAWERNGLSGMVPSGDPEADTQTIIANLRPAWTWFNPATGTWSEPEEFPIEGANGFNVQFMHSGTGQRAGIAWLESDTGSLFPWDLEAANPSQGRIGGIRLRHAQLFRPIGFAGEDPPPVQILGEIATLGDEDPETAIPDDIVEYSAGRDLRVGGATETIILVTRMTDVLSVEPFRPVMRIESWGAPGFGFVGGNELTLRGWQEDVPISSNPQVRISQNVRTTGVIRGPHLLLGRHQSGGGTPPLPAGATGVDPGYEMVEFDPDDPAIPQGAVFQSYSLVDLPYPPGQSAGTTHNPPRGIVHHKPDEQGRLKLHFAGSERRNGPITHGSDTDRHASVMLASDGSLLTMYQKVPIRRTPVTRKIGGTEEELILVEEEELGYFAMSRRIIATELMAGQVRHRSGLFLPGHRITLEAEVHNVGDYDVSGLRMSLYALPQDTKGVDLIPIVENELVLAFSFSRLSGNDTAIKQVDWVVPDDRSYSFILIVDPDNEIDEFDENNNMRESFIPAGVPAEIVEWLLGRFAGDTSGFDRNEDEVIDSADILP